MAQLLSPIGSMIRGSVAGLTFTATRNAPIVIRRRIAPMNTFTNPRTASRGSLAAAVALWNTLTETQRGDWDNFGLTLTKTKPEGTYTLTGREAMIGITQFAHRMKQLGLISTDPSGVAPVLFGWLPEPTYTPTTLITTGVGFRVRYQYLLGSAQDIFYCLSEAGSPRRNYRLSRWSQATWNKLSLSGITDSHLVFTGLVEGAAYYVKFRSMTNAAPFHISNLQTVRAIAQTYP